MVKSVVLTLVFLGVMFWLFTSFSEGAQGDLQIFGVMALGLVGLLEVRRQASGN